MGVFLLADFLTVTKSAGRNGEYVCWQISWLSTNLLAEMRGVIHVGRVPVTKSASGNGGISAGRFPDCQQICWQKWGELFMLAEFLSPNLPVEMGIFLLADFLTVNKSAGRNEGSYSCWQSSCHKFASGNGGISAGRFTDCQQICWQKWGDISVGSFPDCQQICWQKWEGNFCWQIYWLSPYLQAGMGGISASRFPDCQQICWQKWGWYICCQISWVSPNFELKGGNFCQQISWLSANLLAEMRGYFCWQISLMSPNLPIEMGWFLLVDFLTATKYAGRFNDCQQICQQIWQKWGKYFCWQSSWLSTNLLAEIRGVISAGRFPDCQQICRQKWGGYFYWQIFWLSANMPTEMGGFLPAELLTVTKYAGRFNDCQQICQ